MRIAKILSLCLSLTIILIGCSPGAESQTERGGRLRGGGALERGADTPVPAGVEQAQITVNGQARTFLYYAPPGRSSRPAVVLSLHGGRGSGAKYISQTPSMLSYADQLGFVAVYPDATENWNDGREGFAGRPSDIAFLSAVIDWMAINLNADRSRVFVTGASNGGAMSYKIACDAPGLVAAIAPIISSLSTALYASCAPGQPVPVVMFNGTEDPLNVYAGGTSTSRLAQFAEQSGGVAGAVATAEFWARVNGCSLSPASENLPDTTNDGTTVTLIRYNCPRDAVWLYRINGGGHSIPGMQGNGPGAERLVGRTSQDIDAVGRAVAFFQTYGL